MKAITIAYVCLLSAGAAVQNLHANEDRAVLDPAMHPGSQAYESIFPDSIVPIDTQLSWKRRFLDNEIFNADEALPQTSPRLQALPGNKAAMAASNPEKLDATGIVKQVKASEGKIKIEHGPIERLGMPAMTMMFRVEDGAQLDGLKKGDEVSFDVENTAAGFSISRLETSSGRTSVKPDATGIVKQVKASEGKIKIEHGPIERLGMPAMTMMFRVNDPSVLNTLKKDMEVEFDVANSAAGFEVTNIRPLGAAQGIGATERRLCYTIGPFKQRSHALAVGGRYRSLGATTVLEADVERALLGTMVYIDSHPTRDAALKTAAELAANGVTDYLIVNEPGKQHALSLGVFGQKQNAARLKSRIETMNYTVKTEPRYRRQTVYWLQNEQAGISEPPNLLAAEDIHAGVGQAARVCSAMEDA